MKDKTRKKMKQNNSSKNQNPKSNPFLPKALPTSPTEKILKWVSKSDITHQEDDQQKRVSYVASVL